jgi:hypothetical protein
VEIVNGGHNMSKFSSQCGIRLEELKTGIRTTLHASLPAAHLMSVERFANAVNAPKPQPFY